MDIKLEPNMDILIPETDDGGDNMSDDSQKIYGTVLKSICMLNLIQ